MNITAETVALMKAALKNSAPDLAKARKIAGRKGIGTKRY